MGTFKRWLLGTIFAVVALGVTSAALVAGDRMILMSNPGVGSTGLEQNGGTIDGPLDVTGQFEVTDSTLLVPAATSVLTGSINPTASTTLTGVGTLFLSELSVGDKITVSAETRTVVAIASNTSLTVDTATTDTANDTSVDRYPVGLAIVGTDTSVATDFYTNPAVKSSGYVMENRVGNILASYLDFSGKWYSRANFISDFHQPLTNGAFRSYGSFTNLDNYAFVYNGAPAIHAAGTKIAAFVSAPVLSSNHTGGDWISFYAPDLVSADADIVKYGLKIGTGYTYPIIAVPPTAQTIAAGNTITADACGTMKQITAAGAVTTDTTNTFTAPAAANSGCCMDVVNVGAQNITLDNNALFFSPAAGNVVMTGNDSIRVCSNGTAWYAITALVAN